MTDETKPTVIKDFPGRAVEAPLALREGGYFLTRGDAHNLRQVVGPLKCMGSDEWPWSAHMYGDEWFWHADGTAPSSVRDIVGEEVYATPSPDVSVEAQVAEVDELLFPVRKRLIDLTTDLNAAENHIAANCVAPLPQPDIAVREALDLLQLQQRGRAQALRLLDQKRQKSDPATLAQADAYEECGNELRAALSAPRSAEAPVAFDPTNPSFSSTERS
jgi:hypothetical protein